MYNPNMTASQPQFGFNKASNIVSLYVGDLDQNIHEEQLYDFFSKITSVQSVRIMKDLYNGRSRGFGFVNFFNTKDAELAKEKAQYAKLGRKQIRIMFKRDIKSLPQDANIFVSNLDPKVTVRELHEYFEQVKPVVCAKISTNNEGESKGYGYVQFSSHEDAEAAIQALNGTRLRENEIQLSIFQNKNDRFDENAKTRLYVKDLPSNKSKDELEAMVREVFAEYGDIETIAINKHPKEEKYSALVSFKEEEAALFAYNNLNSNPVTLEGADKPLYVNWHQDKAQRAQEYKSQGLNEQNLFVKNLKPDVTEEAVKDAFQQFGKVTSVSCKDPVNSEGKKFGRFAFISFENVDDAKRVQVEGLVNQQIKDLFLDSTPYINVHQPKDKRTQFLNSRERGKAQTNMYSNMMEMNPYGMNPYSYMGGNFNPYMYPQMMMNPMSMMNPMGGQFQQQQQMRGGNRYQKGGQGLGQQQGGGFNKVPYQKFQGQGQGQGQGQVQGNRPHYQNYNKGQGYQQNRDQNQQYQNNRRGNYNNQHQNRGEHYQQQNRSENYQQQNRGEHYQQGQGQGQNQPTQQRQPKPAQNQFQAEVARGSVSLETLQKNVSAFLALDDEKQRMILGQLMFPLIQPIAGELAPRITGMLIDLSVLELSEILEMLENPALLQERVIEARDLILGEDQ